MNAGDQPLMLWIEGLLALGFMLAFLIHSVFAFKPQHLGGQPGRVRVGAAIQGLMLGLLIGFVIVPLRMQVMDARGYDPAVSPQLSSLSLLPAVLLLVLIRRGGLLRAPLMSPFLRAYRRASLLRARDETDKALTKLDELEARRAPA